MFVVAEHFLSDVVDDYGSHPVSTDGGSWYPSQACKFL
jgi:putative transposase